MLVRYEQSHIPTLYFLKLVNHYQRTNIRNNMWNIIYKRHRNHSKSYQERGLSSGVQWIFTWRRRKNLIFYPNMRYSDRFWSAMPVRFFKNPRNSAKKNISGKTFFTHNVIYKKNRKLLVNLLVITRYLVITWYLTSNYLPFYQ